MKRNFLKNSLAAFAFSLAIVASFAFSNAQNDAVDEIPGFIIDGENCVSTETTCNDLGIQICTVGHINGNDQIYEDQVTTTSCQNLLKDNRQTNP